MNYRAQVKSFAKDRLSSQFGTTLGAWILASLPQWALVTFSAVLSVFLGFATYFKFYGLIFILGSIMTVSGPLTELATYALMPFTLVGIPAFMLSAVRGKREKATFPFSVVSKNYIKLLGGVLWQMLFIYLWTFLFIIPGIVKGYAYSFNSYILTDCPNLSIRQALNLSKRMTKGIKSELFLFDLSFIGWWLLVAITGGLAAIYVVPYYQMAKATLYESMKNSALETGKITAADLDPTVVAYENYSQN